MKRDNGGLPLRLPLRHALPSYISHFSTSSTPAGPAFRPLFWCKVSLLSCRSPVLVRSLRPAVRPARPRPRPRPRPTPNVATTTEVHGGATSAKLTTNMAWEVGRAFEQPGRRTGIDPPHSLAPWRPWFFCFLLSFFQQWAIGIVVRRMISVDMGASPGRDGRHGLADHHSDYPGRGWIMSCRFKTWTREKVHHVWVQHIFSFQPIHPIEPQSRTRGFRPLNSNSEVKRWKIRSLPVRCR